MEITKGIECLAPFMEKVTCPGTPTYHHEIVLELDCISDPYRPWGHSIVPATPAGKRYICTDYFNLCTCGGNPRI